MNKLIYIVLCLILCCCDNNKNITINIIHTNDLHSHLLPFNEYGDCAIDSPDCLGGFARIATYMINEKQNNPNTIILDSGDRFTGTSFYSLTKSKYLLPIFKLMPYDAVTLGNHEFDDNLDETISFIRQWNIPIIATNINCSNEEELQKYLQKSLIIEKENRKIGLIGLLTTETNILNGRKISITPIIENVKTEIEKLKSQNINIIIVVSHIGYEEDLQLAKTLTDIDIILGGHSHTLFTNDKSNPLRHTSYPKVINNKTLIVSNGIGGQYIGHLQVEFDKLGNIIKYNGNSIKISYEIPNNKNVATVVQEASNNLKKILEQKITTLPKTYGYTQNTNYCSEQCPLGEYVAYLLAQEIPNIDGVILNSGSFRSSLAKGDIYFKNLLEIYPYDSPAVIIQLTGKEIIQYVNHGLSHYHKKDKTNEMLQTWGINYTFSATSKKATDIKINNKPIDSNKTYNILTSSFIANGGDKYPRKSYITVGSSVQDILKSQMQKNNNYQFIGIIKKDY